MNFYERHVLPRMIDFGMRARHINVERIKAVEGVRGNVLEIGFGSGLNLPFYSSSVARVVGVDPSEVAWKLAQKRVARCSFPVERLVQSGETLPAADASFDCVVSTFTLCTIPDVQAALREVKRVLAPAGRFYFLEHGLSDDPRIQRRQEWWDPMQGRLFGGCHVNRAIDRLITDAGLRIERVERFWARGPRVMSSFYRGVAVKDA